METKNPLDIPHPLETRDKADLFNFLCLLMSPGPLCAWWDAYPSDQLPHGGRAPTDPKEAENFVRWTRSMAIGLDLWKAL